MNRNIIKVGLGALCLIGGFLPMSSAGGYFINISHIGGLSWLLYPLALAALGLALTSVYKPEILYLRLWTGIVALSGLILAALTVSSATDQLNYLANSFSSFSMLRGSEQSAEKVSASIGSGGIMAAVGYLCLLLLSLVQVRAAQNRQGGQQ